MSDPRKILFVDDDKDFLKSQSIYFTSRGYQVLTAEGGQEAIALLEKEVPDIIILDLMMEHFDSGFTLANRIRKDERLQGTPLVMLSGVASRTGHRFDRAKESLGRWSGLDAFLDKPITGRQLLKVIEERTGLAG